MARPVTEAPETQIYFINHRSGAFLVLRLRTVVRGERAMKVAHARLLATGEATTSFEPVPGLDLEHVVIHDSPVPAECVLVFWSCAAVTLAWLVFFYKY